MSSRRSLALLSLVLWTSVALSEDVEGGHCSAQLDVYEGRGMEVSLLSLNVAVERRVVKASDLELEVSQEEQSITSHAPWTFYNYILIPLLIGAAVAAWYTRPQLESQDEITPSFVKFRSTFLSVWAVAVCADWLQGPYVYALYASFGYEKSDIDKLFVAGFAASMVFGTFVGSLADAWGRKRTTVAYCILYIISCLTKHCSLYYVLLVGRITGGMATSLLFSAFECWMVSESNERHQFSNGLLRYMFSMMYFVNFLVAIASGLFAQTLVDAVPMRRFPGSESLHYGGNICPFDLAIVMLCIALPMICLTWPENYGDALGQTTLESFAAAWRTIISSWKVSVIGVVMACFEGSMYTFVINWTPSLALNGAPPPPHGLVFSALMMCCMVGSSIFSFFNPRVNPAKVLMYSCFIACISFGVIALRCGEVDSVSVVYTGFLAFEGCVGLYMPAMGALKSELVPEEARAGIYNWYRIPLNIVVCSVILTDMPLQSAFTVCAALVALGTLLVAPMALTPYAEKSSKGS